MRLVILLSVLMGGAGCGGRRAAEPADAQSSSDVQVPGGTAATTPTAGIRPFRPAVVEELGEEYDLGSYRIRPPKALDLKSDDELPDGMGRIVVWQDEEGLRTFSVQFLTFKGIKTPVSPSLVRIAGQTDSQRILEETAPEKTTLANLPFESSTAIFSYRRTERLMTGIIYAHAADQKGILITYAGPSAEEERKRTVAQAAIRTFRKP